jgi:hypothetical protein
MLPDVAARKAIKEATLFRPISTDVCVGPLEGCLPIRWIGGFKFFGWCCWGGDGDPIRCVHPSALSPLLWRLATTSWWSRENVLFRSTCCACDRWKMVYNMLVLWMETDSFDFLPRHRSRAGYQFWSSIACPRTCCLGLIISTTKVLPMTNYFRGPKSCWSAMDSCRARVLWCPFSGRFGGVEGGG